MKRSSVQFACIAALGFLLASPTLFAQNDNNQGKERGRERSSPRGQSQERRGERRESAAPGQTAPRQPEARHEAAPAASPRGRGSEAPGRQFGRGGENGPAGNTRPNIAQPEGQQRGNDRPNFSRPDQPRGNDRPNFGRPDQPRGNDRPNFGRPAAGNAPMGRPPEARRGPEIVRTHGGGEIRRGPGGFVREVRTPNGAIIHHAPGGVRRVEMVRPGGRVVVAGVHGHVGYVQRPLIIRNTTYVQRTYVYRNASYVRLYRPWAWGGFTFHVYTPVRYYRPAFYSWAWSPWPRPIYYRWGWMGDPWYRYWGGWFTPYPYYSSPALWLTDYLIAATLDAAYQERIADAAAAQASYGSAGQVPLSPEVKQQIADEVHRQLEAEQATGGDPGGSPALFSDNGSHVFVVSTPLQVDDGGMGCALTEGDVLQMNGNPPPGANSSWVGVLAGKPQDCRKGSQVQVALDDLVEMQNQMRATLDQGLNDLQSKQGQEGLPTLPSNMTGAANTQLAADVRPDSNAAAELSQAAQDADRQEQDVMSQASSGATVSISLGMSIADVEQAMGRPKSIADLGSKKIYVYPDLKITFVDGRVADVN